MKHTSWSQSQYLEEHENNVRDQSSYLLAKMPEDHWVSLDAGRTEGTFITKPWGPPHEVFVNAEGGSVEVELVTPYGQVMPGYSRADCIGVTGNGKKQQIKWKNGRPPWDFADEQRGGVLVKFYLRNTKLYSYTFTLPDPEGNLEIDRLNARWCEVIKHRSDNWGDRSNEPAIGLPTYTGPSPV